MNCVFIVNGGSCHTVFAISTLNDYVLMISTCTLLLSIRTGGKTPKAGRSLISTDSTQKKYTKDVLIIIVKTILVCYLFYVCLLQPVFYIAIWQILESCAGAIASISIAIS